MLVDCPLRCCTNSYRFSVRFFFFLQLYLTCVFPPLSAHTTHVQHGVWVQVPLLVSKILGHIGELLTEYRELGALLESSAPGAGAEAALTPRQELLLQRFETSRESFLRYYRNAAQDQPYETADYYVRQV